MEGTSTKSREQRTSKFAEGRLKLSTSCTECHRRKQKCDQKQPCRHCARRYPPPQCVYRHVKDLAASKEAGNLSAQSESDGTIPIARVPLSSSDSNRQGTTIPSSGLVWEGENQSENDKPTGSRLSPDRLDEWAPSEYQNLVGAMVTHLGDSLTTADERTDSSSPSSSTDASTSITTSDQAGSPKSSHRVPISANRNGFSSAKVGPPSSFSITSVDPLHFLGITPTYQSGELLNAFIKIISKYVVSIDGIPGPNYYNDVWVPWCVKSPLLAYFAIFTASCYQSEAQKIPPQQSAVVLGYKLKTIGLLNETLRNKETSTSLEALTAVGYIITSEWYWSNYENVKAHLKGLKEMVRLRGGLGQVNDFSRKMIILIDYQISCSYDIDLSFPHNTATHVSYPTNMSTPLLYSLVSFQSMHAKMGIAEETAKVLDDSRYLLMAALKHSDSIEPQEDQDKLTTIAIMIQNRISKLPTGTEPGSSLSSDNIYKSCRNTAFIYIRAILSRTPLSEACTMQDLVKLWSSMWRVTLTQWKHIPGIFLWVILSALQAAQTTPHGRFLKSMFKASSAYMGMDHFEVVDAALMNVVKIQRWLRESKARQVKQETPEKNGHLAYIHNYR